MNHWKTIESRYLLESPWISLREDRVDAGGGQIVEPFYVVEYPDWSCIVAIDSDERLILVEQYRHGIGRVSLELPAGVIDKGESPLEAAKRELMEETGYEADEWNALSVCAPEPSKHTNFAHVFVARGARPSSRQDLDSTETIKVRHVALSDLGELIASGEFIHGIHLYAVLLAQSRLSDLQ